jgi:hypothetical protein
VRVFVAAVILDGSGQFERITTGQGRIYNGSQVIDGTSGCTISVTQNNSSTATITFTMDDYGRNYTILAVGLHFYNGIYG